jgi:hypothetical protein
VSRVEVLKAMDKYGLISNSSHGILDIRRYWKMLLIMKCYFSYEVMESDNHPDPDEKQRRRLQNEFRSDNACRIIKDNFTKSSVDRSLMILSKKNGT